MQNPILTPNFSNVLFKFEPFLRKEYNLALNPDRPQCKFFEANGTCPNGSNCYNKHVSPMFRNKVVCKHWLRGLCKKGDSCDYLHEYNLRKMPECLFFSKNGFCTQTPECIYLHIDPQTKIPECFNYNRGFCPDGPACNKRHIRKTFCELYLTGFCPYGAKCNLGAHPKFEGLLDKLRIKPDKKEETKNEGNTADTQTKEGKLPSGKQEATGTKRSVEEAEEVEEPATKKLKST